MNKNNFTLTAILLLSCIWALGFLYDVYRHNPGFSLDFEPYYLQAQAIRSGTPPPYEVHGTKLGWNLGVTMPLTYALLIMPLSFLTLPQAELVLCLLNIGMVLGMIWILRDVLQLDAKHSILLTAITISSFPVLHGIECGQASIIMAFITIASLYLYFKSSIRLSALLLGLAGSIKIIPLIILTVFFAHRKFKYICLCVASFLFFQILTSLAAGWENTWYFWSTHFLTINNQVSGFLYNQSIIGFLHRFLPKSIASSWINQLVPAALLGGATLYLMVKHNFFSRTSPTLPPIRNDQLLILELAIICLTINISSPLGWPHQFVWICLPIAALLHEHELGNLTERDIILMTIGLFLLFIPFEIINNEDKSLRLVSVFKAGFTLYGTIIILLVLTSRLRELINKRTWLNS